MARKVDGVRAFQWPVYDPYKLAGGWSFLAPAGGNFAHVSLFNNASDGSWLYVLDVNGSTSGGAALIYELAYGNQGFTIDAGSTAGLVSDQPLPWGQIGTFQTAACLGTHRGGTGNTTINAQIMNNRYPLGIVAPGWSFIVEGGAGAQTVVAGIWWYVGRTP